VIAFAWNESASNSKPVIVEKRKITQRIREFIINLPSLIDP
jgi:hypothetical protein